MVNSGFTKIVADFTYWDFAKKIHGAWVNYLGVDGYFQRLAVNFCTISMFFQRKEHMRSGAGIGNGEMFTVIGSMSTSISIFMYLYLSISI